jgi:hypothetical protein
MTSTRHAEVPSVDSAPGTRHSSTEPGAESPGLTSTATVLQEHAADLSPDPTSATERTHRYDRLAVAIVVATAVALCCLLVPKLTGPFGDSHDGRNAGVWASGSRALREDGAIASRLGGIHEDGTAYAHHPPLILLETALTESVAGEHPASTRLPVLLSTLVALVFSYLSAKELGLRPIASALGAAVGFLCPMVLTYGVMLDTPMTSLAFGAVVLWLWCRVRNGRAPSVWIVAGVAALACLSGWEAMLLSWLAVAGLLLPRLRPRPPQPTAGRALLAGSAVGTGATLAWAWWVSGSLGELWTQLVVRSGGQLGATRLGAATNQVHWLSSLLGPALLGVAFLAAGAVLDGRRRAAFVLLLVTTLGYPAILYNAAFIHDYWNYWFVLPAALGFAWAGDRFLDGVGRRTRSSAVPVALLTLATLLLVVGQVVRETPSGVTLEQGVGPGRLLSSADISAGAIGYIGGTYDPDSWMSYSTRLPVTHMVTVEQLDRFAAEHPSASILLDDRCENPANTLCAPAWAAVSGLDGDDGVPDWQLVTSTDLADRVAASSTR